MFKINLEEKLLKQNKKYLSNQEQLFVDMVNNILTEDAEEDKTILLEAGFIDLVSSSNEVRNKEKRYHKEYKKYKERLFTENQIRSLCLKYDLRFLSTDYFKGNIPTELPSKIKKFKQEFNLSDTFMENFKICAPESSFKLVSYPKDPLLFYQVAPQLYVLVYKWGKDLSITNRISGLIKSNIIISYIVFLSTLLTSAVFFHNQKNLNFFCIFGGLIVISLVFGIPMLNDYSYKKNWNLSKKNKFYDF